VTPEQLYWRDDGGIVAEIRFRGVHTGPYLGIEPTGREIDVPVVILANFTDGLMAGERFYYGIATIGRQLGVLPALV
jgi:predicted ester cyclase